MCVCVCVLVIKHVIMDFAIHILLNLESYATCKDFKTNAKCQIHNKVKKKLYRNVDVIA